MSPLLALSAVSTSPSPARALRWPELGARLEAGGRVYLLVPGLVVGEVGPPGRAWVLLEYGEGRLLAAALKSEWGWAGATIEWPDAGPQR